MRKGGDLAAQLPENLPVTELRVRTATAVPALARALRRHGTQVLFSTQLHNNLAAAALRAVQRDGCRTVLRESNMPSAHNRAGGVRRTTADFLARRLYRFADAYVAVSDAVARDMASWYRLDPERIHTIANPVIGPDHKLRAGEPLTHPWIGEEGTALLVTAGRVVRQKGHDTLLEALSLADRDGPVDGRRLKLVILGRYGEEEPWYRELQQRIVRLGLQERVLFTGFLENPLPWIAAADLFVLPSRREGLPAALIEALACGTPVVSSDCPGGCAEILDGGRYGTLVPPDSPRELARAIRRRLGEEHDRQALRERAEYWNLERRAADYLALAREVAGAEVPAS